MEFSVTLTTLDGTQHDAAIGAFLTLAGAKAYANVWLRAQEELSTYAETDGDRQSRLPLAAVIWNDSGNVVEIVGFKFLDMSKLV